jgi:hypothetical protein
MLFSLMQNPSSELCPKMAANVGGIVSCRLWATHYTPKRNYKRVVTLKFSTNTAINYTTGYSQFLF